MMPMFRIRFMSFIRFDSGLCERQKKADYVRASDGKRHPFPSPKNLHARRGLTIHGAVLVP